MRAEDLGLESSDLTVSNFGTRAYRSLHRKVRKKFCATLLFFYLLLLFGSTIPCACPLSCPQFFLIILFVSTTLTTGMTSISLHMQWPPTSQLLSSFSQRKQLFFFHYGSNSTPYGGA
jgi:hypothetical protein